MLKKTLSATVLILYIVLNALVLPMQAAQAYQVFGKHYTLLKTAKNYNATGIASWYGSDAQGKPTASGARYNMYHMTAAHKTLPLYTYVEVTNLNNGRHTIVQITDRGPFISGRIIDLSYAAAKKIGIVNSGLARVNVKTISSAKV